VKYFLHPLLKSVNYGEFVSKIVAVRADLICLRHRTVEDAGPYRFAGICFKDGSRTCRCDLIATLGRRGADPYNLWVVVCKCVAVSADEICLRHREHQGAPLPKMWEFVSKITAAQTYNKNKKAFTVRSVRESYIRKITHYAVFTA